MTKKPTTYKNVKDYYGEKLASNKDLQTSACCIEGSIPNYQKDILKLIDNEIKDKFYGCGSPIPPALEGIKALDLGCVPAAMYTFYPNLLVKLVMSMG